MMAAVRGVDTSPELYVRRHLYAEGFRYRVHLRGLPGRPDVGLRKFGIVVFVHGCFWHGHSCVRGRRPTSNAAFWNAKIDGNISRDKRNMRALRSLGWSPMVIWECRLEASTRRLLERLRQLRHDGTQG